MHRLLFIGNGFDIAHNKCTKYMDFLYACAKLINKDDFKYNISDEYKTNLDKVSNKFIEKYNTEEIKKQIQNNLWIQHFFYICNERGKDWIDFETEIQNLCKNKIHYKTIKPDQITAQATYNTEYYYDDIFDQEALEFCETKKLSKHLSELIELLNKYLLIVDEIECDCYSPNVLWFAPTNVISFNYTNTFEKIYYDDHLDNSIDYIDYIHGHIGENNNIVLGFNEIDEKYLLEYADLLKDYQMINNEVTLDVFNKLREKSDKDYKEIYSMYMGHSLDVTDAYTIKESIRISKKVFILYYDENHKVSMIRNLFKIFKREEFDNLCLSHKRKIYFLKQADMIKIDDIKYVKNYFKCINGMKERTLEYFKSREFDKLNLNAENYLYLLEQLSGCNNLYKEISNNQNAKLISDINKDLYLKMMNNHNLNYFDYDFEAKQYYLFGYELDIDTGEKGINNFSCPNDEEYR